MVYRHIVYFWAILLPLQKGERLTSLVSAESCYEFRLYNVMKGFAQLYKLNNNAILRSVWQALWLIKLVDTPKDMSGHKTSHWVDSITYLSIISFVPKISSLNICIIVARFKWTALVYSKSREAIIIVLQLKMQTKRYAARPQIFISYTFLYKTEITRSMSAWHGELKFHQWPFYAWNRPF